jgi:universal stress protein A
LTFKSILVPIDFSDCSQAALNYAVRFAERFNTTLTLLHVLPVNYVFGAVPELPDYHPWGDNDFEREINAKLSKAAAETIPSHISTRVETRRGVPAVEIINAAQTFQTDLIIMVTHGHTGRVHAFLGSVSGDVTRLAPCPVLVLPGPETRARLDHPSGNPS